MIRALWETLVEVCEGKHLYISRADKPPLDPLTPTPRGDTLRPQAVVAITWSVSAERVFCAVYCGSHLRSEEARERIAENVEHPLRGRICLFFIMETLLQSLYV